jgi:T5SS/PEP-CTERM-associated repeat protein
MKPVKCWCVRWTAWNPSIWAAFLIACALLPAQFAPAQDLWQTGTSSWFTASNWTAGVPVTTTNARLNNGGTANIVGDSAAADFLILGAAEGESGTVAVFSIGGFAGSLNVNKFLVVGNLGNGTMRISGIGAVTNQSSLIGSFGTSVGTVSVTGPNATWTTAQVLGMGNGSFTISAGGKVTAGDAVIASNSAGLSTTTTITGAGSTFTVTGRLDLGFGSPPFGTDVMTIADGGLLKVNGLVAIRRGGTLHVGAGAAAGALQVGGIANDSSLNFNHAGPVTLASPLTGVCTVFKNVHFHTTHTR